MHDEIKPNSHCFPSPAVRVCLPGNSLVCGHSSSSGAMHGPVCSPDAQTHPSPSEPRTGIILSSPPTAPTLQRRQQEEYTTAGCRCKIAHPGRPSNLAIYTCLRPPGRSACHTPDARRHMYDAACRCRMQDIGHRPPIRQITSSVKSKSKLHNNAHSLEPSE